MRRFWEDAETGRRGITDGDLPDGPLVEEISAIEFYRRETEALCACGKVEMDGKKCALGATHRELHPTIRYFYHPEGDCLFTTEGDVPPETDGLVEEIDKEEYERIAALQSEAEALS